MSDEYDLAKSSKKLGPLVPILKDKNGNIIDGFHRQNANPDWPTITVESVDSDAKLELARLATNFCRRRLEPSEIQNRLTFLVGKCGMKPEEIAEQTGIHLTTIYRHLPQELKDAKKGEAISEGMKKASELAHASSTVKTQDMQTCEVHGTASSDTDFITILGKPRRLCGRCRLDYPNNTLRYESHFRHLNGESKTLEERLAEKPGPAFKEKWEQTLGTMQTDDPKVERIFSEEAQALGLHGFRVKPEIPVISVWPDNFHVETKTLFWMDNEELHKGKRSDKDDQYRAILEGRGFKNEVFRYKGEPSKAKVRAFLEAWQKKTGA